MSEGHLKSDEYLPCLELFEILKPSIFLKCSPLEHHLTSHAPWPRRQQMCKHVSMKECTNYSRSNPYSRITGLNGVAFESIESSGRKPLWRLQNTVDMITRVTLDAWKILRHERTPRPRDSLRKVNLYFLKVNRYAVPSFITKVQHT